MPKPRYFPPLTRDQLRLIYETNPTPAVKRLLWEIRRLRRIVVQGHAFLIAVDRVRHGNKLDPASTKALDALRVSIGREPAISEDLGDDPED